MNFSFKDFKFSFPFFAKTGHFWTWKYQNLESRHQNCQSPSISTLRNERLLSLLILTFWALKLIFWSKIHKILSKMYISSKLRPKDCGNRLPLASKGLWGCKNSFEKSFYFSSIWQNFETCSVKLSTVQRGIWWWIFL